MKRSSTLEVENSDGERFGEIDCPSHVKATIERAIEQDRQCGTVYGDGKAWHWRIPPDEVVFEFTRDEVVVQKIAIPGTAWEAWRLAAHNRGVEPRSWLTVVLGEMMASGITLETSVQWLFPAEAETPEVKAFEEAQARFHGRASGHVHGHVCGGRLLE